MIVFVGGSSVLHWSQHEMKMLLIHWFVSSVVSGWVQGWGSFLWCLYEINSFWWILCSSDPHCTSYFSPARSMLSIKSEAASHWRTGSDMQTDVSPESKHVHHFLCSPAGPSKPDGQMDLIKPDRLRVSGASPPIKAETALFTQRSHFSLNHVKSTPRRAC